MIVTDDDSSTAKFKMESSGKQSLTVENIKYVRNFLKFALHRAQLSDEVENERNMCITLLGEAVEYLTERDKNSQDRMHDTPATNPLYNVDLINTAPEELELYANVPSGVPNPGSDTLGSYSIKEAKDGREDIYVSMNANDPQMSEINNGASNNEIDYTESNQEHYVNSSMIRSPVSLKSANGGITDEDSVQQSNETVKLFSSATNIEDKWKRLSADDIKCVGPGFQQEAIRTLNTMKKQSSVYIKKNCFCFGYLYHRKRKLFGHIWKRVYSVMRKNVMFLYKSEFEEKATEVIILNGYDVFEVNEQNGKAGFQLVPVVVAESSGEKARPTHRFRCDSADFEVWQKAFSFPAKQTKKDKEREMAWLTVAKAFDHSASNENLPAKDIATFPCDSRKGRRKTDPLTSTLVEVNTRGRRGTDYSCEYRSPCPLPSGVQLD